ncbi:hypothetical protein [Acetobacter thailandicus]|uniref:hypothetical protein n=1 Tax=Acetobacter thailandicus TaxID=1502842 RepID=UPI001BA49BA9|nr:hypothetical protein [Acetobacter thailandicus]MBS1004607.1 hypothetical protein [Acetobacter thailandicus]
MAKKPVVLDGLLNTENLPTNTGIPQRGAEQVTGRNKKSVKRSGEKRLTLALDGDTYKRLRIHAAKTDQTHQSILEAALADLLDRANA